MALRLRTLCGLFLSLLLGWAQAAWAQDSYVKSLMNTVNDAAGSTEKLIPGWTTAANWNLRFAIAVGLLGIVAATLQLLAPAEAKGDAAPPAAAGQLWKRLGRLQWIMIIVGALISGLTLVMNLGFAADHREYRKSAAQAKQVIAELKKRKLSFERSPDVQAYDRLERLGEKTTEKEREDLSRLYTTVSNLYETKFAELVTRLGDIEEQLVATALPLGVPVAYAAVPSGPTVTASAESNNGWQAEENSHAAAVQKMLAQLIQSASVKLGDRELDSLRTYIEQYAKSQVSPEGATNGRIRVRTQLSMPASHASPASIKAFLGSQAAQIARAGTIEEEIQKIRDGLKSMSSSPNFDGFLEATATVPLDGGSVRLQAKDSRGGDFVFRFGVQASLRQSSSRQNVGGPVQLRLEAMEVHQDSSVGSTRWTFYVLSGNRVILSVPEQRWDDSKRPTICWLGPDAGLTGQAAVVSGRVPLTIVGLKPKVETTK